MKKKVLLAEDDDGIIQVVTMILESESYRVITARTEKEVYSELKKGYPDIILLDISLGASDGGKLAKKLKQTPDTKLIPVVISSANSETKTIAKMAGADGFLLKPFEIDTLLSTVKKYC